MIGQSVINIKSGGRGRLSTLVAGSVLLILVVFLNDFVAQIPMAALVAVMIMVSIGTFDWQSIRKLKKHPTSTNVVMIATVVVVVYSHNLAYGVFVGVLLASLFFANKISHFMYVEKSLDDSESIRTYEVHGQVFFNTASRFLEYFNFKEAVIKVVIDVSRAHFWDISAVHALDMAVVKFRREGAEVEIIGLNRASETIVDRFGVHDKPAELAKVFGDH
jgi:SulP family sulfate permease